MNLQIDSDALFAIIQCNSKRKFGVVPIKVGLYLFQTYPDLWHYEFKHEGTYCEVWDKESWENDKQYRKYLLSVSVVSIQEPVQQARDINIIREEFKKAVIDEDDRKVRQLKKEMELYYANKQNSS